MAMSFGRMMRMLSARLQMIIEREVADDYDNYDIYNVQDHDFGNDTSKMQFNEEDVLS